MGGTLGTAVLITFVAFGLLNLRRVLEGPTVMNRVPQGRHPCHCCRFWTVARSPPVISASTHRKGAGSKFSFLSLSLDQRGKVEKLEWRVEWSMERGVEWSMDWKVASGVEH